VLIEAGDLKKGAPLRSAVEAADAAIALPCYADDGRDLDALIDRELTRAGMTMALDARQALRRNLGGDRMASVGEIEKLALYAHGRGQIALDDVRALGGDVSGQSFDDAVDAMLEGRIGDFDAAFTRQCQAGGQPFLALASAMRQMQGLHAMRGRLDAGGGTAAAVVAGQKPPVFFSRRKLIETALARWTSPSLERALERLQNAVLQTRRRPDLSVPIARQALLGIAAESARLARR
jgi:DNA polymerase-3 subunit delta